MSKQPKRFYECGPFVLDPLNHVLSRGGSPLPLPPKAFDTLMVLVEHGGDLVEKEQLLKAVWPDTFVEENNLTQYISLLRRVLGDNSDQRQYIETVPKLGYRFVAPVREVESEQSEAQEAREVASPAKKSEPTAPAPAAERPASLATASPRFSLFRMPSTIFLLGIAVLGLAAIGLLAVRMLRRPQAQAPSVAVEVRRAVAVLGFKNLAGNPEA